MNIVPPALPEVPAASVADEIRSERLLKKFVLTSVAVTLTFGTAWGVSILTEAAVAHSFKAPSYAQTQAHGHAQVFGWIGLLIMGVAYYMLPKLKRVVLPRPGLAEVSFWLMAVGIIARAVSQPLAMTESWRTLNVVSGVLELAAVGLFAVVMLAIRSRSPDRKSPLDHYVGVAVFWLLVACVINLFGLLGMYAAGATIFPEPWNLRRLHVEVFGFITVMILGVGTRLFPKFLGLEPPQSRPLVAALALLSAGVVLRVLGVAPVLASVLQLAAVASYVLALNVFGRPSRTLHAPDAAARLHKWIRVGFFWLIVAGALMAFADVYAGITGGSAPREVVGAYRHAVTVGFITTIAVGVALRIVPLFHGAPLYSLRLEQVAFWLLLVGNLCRVVFQIATLTRHPVFYAITGMSGYLELAALGFFGYNVIRTFLAQPATLAKDGRVRQRTTVGELLEVSPRSANVLAEFGLSSETLAQVRGDHTIGGLARARGINPEHLTRALNLSGKASE
jgi:uncharacterized protein involved in response to NO